MTKLQEEIVELEAKKFVGISLETDNERAFDPEIGAIGMHWGRFISEGVLGKIEGLKGENVYAIYSDYESDENGVYTLTLCGEVEGEVEVSEGLEMKEISRQKYIKFTTERGAIPDVIVEGWRYIWEYFKDSPYERKYSEDFECYDERSHDMNDAQIDIYISIV